MSELELKLWSNVVELHNERRSATKPFVFTMGILVGVVLSGLISYLIS